MPIKYEKADVTVSEMGERLIEKYHATLKTLEVRIDYVFAHNTQGGPALKLHGIAAAGIARILPLKQRCLGRGDVCIELDGEVWMDLSEPAREALLDHELTHFMPIVGKRDAIARPVVRMRLHDHDFGWFEEIAMRHGHASFEVQQATRLLREHRDSYFQPDLQVVRTAKTRGAKASAA